MDPENPGVWIETFFPGMPSVSIAFVDPIQQKVYILSTFDKIEIFALSNR